MPTLKQMFREKVNKSKTPGINNEAEPDVAYSSGFLGLDYLNGTVIHVKSADKDFTYNSVGILDGCATTVIGRPSCGKTTLLLQIGANIIRPFKTSMMFIDDIEGGSNDRRKEILTRFTKEEIEERMDIRNSGITAENLYERIKTIHDIKVANRTEYEYDTGLYDYKGDRIFKLEPTVYMVDSIPMIMPEDIMGEDELSGQMSATAIAKTNTFLFKKISQLLKEANIIMLCINHILDDVNINPFQRKRQQLAYLKQGERLPGGKAAIYLANNMFRVDDRTKLTADKEFGIDGAIVDVEVVKSRTNKTGKSIPMVYNFNTGFDPELSLYQLLKSEGRVNGSGVAYYLRDRKDLKFSQRNFKQKLRENAELRQIFSEECYDVLVGLLSATVDEGDIYQTDVSDMILQMGLNGIVA